MIRLQQGFYYKKVKIKRRICVYALAYFFGHVVLFLTSEGNRMNIVAIVLKIAGVLALIGIVVKIIRRKKNPKVPYEIVRKQREENLKRSLGNFNAKDAIDGQIKPYAVSYSASAGKAPQENQQGKICNIGIQIIESNGLYEKKYLFTPDQQVYLGRRYGVPAIIGKNEEAEKNCLIYYAGGNYCARLVRSVPCTVRRRKQTAEVDSEGICLMSGDVITVSGADFRITMI